MRHPTAKTPSYHSVNRSREERGIWIFTIALLAIPLLTALPVLAASPRSVGSWIDGEHILGGERESVVGSDHAILRWDGLDRDPTSLDHTGLGGVDLLRGSGGQLHLEILAPSALLTVQLTAYTDALHASRHTLQIVAGRGETQRLAVPFTAFAPFLGRGADFANLGAFEIELSGQGVAAVRVGELSSALLAPDPETSIFRPKAARGPVPVPAKVVVQEGDSPPGAGADTVSSLGAPFTDGNGVVGFTGNLTTGGGSDNFVWYDDDIVWRNSDAMASTLTGAEGTLGVGDSGEFFYSPSVDGDDSVWSQNGLVLTEGPAPAFPGGTNNTFNSRPTMIPSGQSYWIAGFDDTGGTTTQGRVLYTSPMASSASISVVLRSDDMVGAFTIDRPSGLGFDYQISDDGNHHIHDLLMDTGTTTNDGFLYVDGGLVARETDPTGDGDNWDNFDVVAINDNGNYLFSGDTDGSTASDEFIAYNGTISLREGDTVDGMVLGSSVNAGSINNRNEAVFIWSVGSEEALFAACDGSDLAASVVLLVSGEEVDVDGDGTGDATVTDFNASNIIGPGLWLAEDRRVFVEVDLDFGAGDLEAILNLDLPCDLFSDGFESGDTTVWSVTVP